MSAQKFPNNITAGNTLVFTIDSDTHSPDDGYSAVLYLRGPSQGSPMFNVEFYARAVYGDQFKFVISATETAKLSEGRYLYAIVAYKVGSPSSLYGSPSVMQFTIEQGDTYVAPRADLNTETDFRTHAEIVLDNIEAVIENRATKDQKLYKINQRELERTPIADLLKLRDKYKSIVLAESKQAKYTLQTRMP